MNETDPIQAQLIAARRNQILDAATRVFADKGFHKATIRDVAKDAGIADGTIYNYFENKTAVLIGILDRLNETPEREQHLSEAGDVGYEEWTRMYMQHRMDVMTAAEPVLRIVLSEVLTNKDLHELYMTQVVEPSFVMADAHFKQWRDAGVIVDMDTALMARALAATLLGMLYLKLMGDETLNTRWSEVSEIVSRIVLKGVLKQGDNHE